MKSRKIRKSKTRARKKKHNFKKFWKLGDPELATKHFDMDANGRMIVRQGNYQYKIFDLIKRFGTSLEIVFPLIFEERLEQVIDTFHY